MDARQHTRFHPPPLGTRAIWFRRLVVASCLLSLGGCAAKRDYYDVPEIPIPEGFRKSAVATHPESPAGVVSPRDPSGVGGGVPAVAVPVPAAKGAAGVPTAARAYRLPFAYALTEWWRLFDNPELDQLINRVLANNPDIRIATLRMMQAKARAEQVDADRYPVITAPVNVSVESPAGGLGSVAPGAKSGVKHKYQASIRGDWRADLWSERLSLFESADMAVRQSLFQGDEVRRTAIATTVSTYIEYLSLNDRVRVARETETTLAGMLQSVRSRLESGDATIIDLEQQRSAVSAVRATIPVLERQRDEAASALALLAGGLPGSLKLSDGGLASLAYPGISPGVPASLLLRRPDVRVVEARLLSADADIDVARARLLPPLDLTAQIGYGAVHSADWFQPHSVMWSAAANLMATIFDKGKRDNEVAFTEAVRQELVETYVRVIYNAVREVEDSLAAIRISGQRAEAQQDATESARRAYQFSIESYMAGAIDYLTLLDTERTFHRNLDELDKVYIDRYKSLVTLFASLGGGISGRDPLPGEGRRPAIPAHEAGFVVSVKSASALGGAMAARSNVYQGIEVVPDSAEESRGYWLVELAGTFERTHVAPAWLDLRSRFPALMANRSLLPKSVGGYGEPGPGRVSWYQLFVAGFEGRREADRMCAALREASMRCRTVSAVEVPSYYAVSVVDAAEASTDRAPAAVRDAGKAPRDHAARALEPAIDPSARVVPSREIESVTAGTPS